MKRILESRQFVPAVVMVLLVLGYQCSSGRKAPKEDHYQTISTNVDGKGIDILLTFTRGKAHNHPLMAIWIEDTTGKYIETLYVAESIGKGIFRHGDKSDGKWQPGPQRRPAALPYWGHKRGVQAPDGYYIPTPEEPMPDAVTSATPAGSFILESRTDQAQPSSFDLLLEINQSWDWNEYWTNSLYPDDDQYKTSSQPSVVYYVRLDLESGKEEYRLEPIGHGHYSGKDGLLYKDLSTLTTALEIVQSITVKVGP